MSDREEREKVIAVLLDMYRWLDGVQYILATRERIHAIAYAIASIKTDLKYDLMYEGALEQEPTTKNDLGVDWESYKDADGNSLDDLILEVLQNNFDCGNTYGYKVADEIIGLLPPVTPIRPKGHWIGHREHCENLGVMPSGLGAYKWCSNCDCGIDVREWHRNHYNFCPNCGADMRGE